MNNISNKLRSKFNVCERFGNNIELINFSRMDSSVPIPLKVYKEGPKSYSLGYELAGGTKVVKRYVPKKAIEYITDLKDTLHKQYLPGYKLVYIMGWFVRMTRDDRSYFFDKWHDALQRALNRSGNMKARKLASARMAELSKYIEPKYIEIENGEQMTLIDFDNRRFPVTKDSVEIGDIRFNIDKKSYKVRQGTECRNPQYFYYLFQLALNNDAHPLVRKNAFIDFKNELANLDPYYKRASGRQHTEGLVLHKKLGDLAVRAQKASHREFLDALNKHMH